MISRRWLVGFRLAHLAVLILSCSLIRSTPAWRFAGAGGLVRCVWCVVPGFQQRSEQCVELLSSVCSSRGGALSPMGLDVPDQQSLLLETEVATTTRGWPAPARRPSEEASQTGRPATAIGGPRWARAHRDRLIDKSSPLPGPGRTADRPRPSVASR